MSVYINFSPLCYMHCTCTLDGHHKLVRRGLVTHCAIDGYSRLVVYIKCSNNNRAVTVYNLFLEAVQHYGLPSRIRCDQGGENVNVVRHMLYHRGEERRSALVGSSVHNQRIERLWRDMHRCVTSIYYRLCYYLEEQELLNPLNSQHIYALHYVFIPRINRALTHFQDAWNNHGIRTERGYTPNQLFTAGALRLRNAGSTALDFFDAVPDTYGIEGEGVANGSSDSDEEGVVVPPVCFELTEEQFSLLQRTVNPLSTSEEFGIDLYIQTLEYLESFNS